MSTTKHICKLPGADMELRLTSSVQVADATYTLTGRVCGAAANRVRGGGSVLVERPDSLVEECFFDEAGQFTHSLQLLPGRDSHVRLTVCDVFGRHLGAAVVTIRHAAGDQAADEAPRRCLEKTIQVEVLNRRRQRVRQTLAPAAAELPGTFRCRLRTADGSPQLVLPLLEDGRLIRRVLIRPEKAAPPGTPVEIEMRCSAERQAEIVVRVERQTITERLSLDATEPAARDAAGSLPNAREFAQLVKHCLILAGQVADLSGRDRDELFQQIYAQESYAEKALRDGDAVLFRECVENLLTALRYLEGLRWAAFGAQPGPSDLFRREWMRGFAGHGDDTDGMLEAVL